MNLKLRGTRSADVDRVLTYVYAGEDEHHLQLAGQLVLNVDEWHLIGTTLILGSKRMDGRCDVMVEGPTEIGWGVFALAEGIDPSYDVRDARRCPDGLRDSLAAYAISGVPLGDFLQAVVANDLVEACVRADATNIDLVPAIAAFVHWELPRDVLGLAPGLLGLARTPQRPASEGARED